MACEAMVHVGRTWTRCGRTPTDLHHRLTRARGGAVLDEVGETYHHMRLCRSHHQMADGAVAYETGLLLDGYVTTCKKCQQPIYAGSDVYLTGRYGPGTLHLQCLSGDVRSQRAGQGLREEAS